MTHPDTFTIPRAVVEQAIEALVHSRSVLNHNNLALQCLPVNTAITALRAALQPQADTSVLQAAPWPPAGDTQTEPEAMRYDFDGYGWKYIDNGSGSDWMTRHPEGEFLFTDPQAAEGCGEAGCAEGCCGTTECLPSFKAKKAAAEPEALQAELEDVKAERDIAHGKLTLVTRERDAALARLAKIEAQEPVGYWGDAPSHPDCDTTPPATQAEAEQHTFNDESPFCVKCGSTGEDAEGPVAHILPRDLKILKFKSMPVPVDPLPYDNGEEKTVPLYTTPPATQAAPVSLQPAHDAVTIDLLNDRVMRQQAALTEALKILKRLEWPRQDTIAAIAQIEATGVKHG